MENAAKALLIAGAVLIVIALISLGVYIISSQKGTIETSKDAGDVTQIAIHNNNFLQYVGSGKSGSEVKNLLTYIQTYNIRSEDDKIGVTYNGEDYTSNLNGLTSSLIMGLKTYEVSAGYSTEGYVNAISITRPE